MGYVEEMSLGATLPSLQYSNVGVGGTVIPGITDISAGQTAFAKALAVPVNNNPQKPRSWGSINLITSQKDLQSARKMNVVDTKNTPVNIITTPNLTTNDLISNAPNKDAAITLNAAAADAGYNSFNWKLLVIGGLLFYVFSAGD